MSWLRIDDGFAEHKRVQKLSDRAFRLHVLALCMCSRKLSDGAVTDIEIRGLAAMCKSTPKHTDELVKEGLWVREPDGYAIRDYLDYNPSADEVKAKRLLTTERQQRWRHNRNASRNALRNAPTNAAPSHPIPKSFYGGNQKPVDKPLSCPECGVGFLTDQRLSEHLSDVHHIDAA